MEAFRPYKTILDSPGSLILEEPTWRKRLMIFILRILPLLYSSVFVAVLLVNNFLPRTIVLLIAAALVIADIILLNIPFVVKIDLSSMYVVVTSNTISGEKQETIAVQDIEKIVYRIRRGKNKALLYFLVLKQGGKRKRLLTFQRLHMGNEKEMLVNKKLSEVTSLPVEG